MAIQSNISLDSGPCVVDKPYKFEMFWERFHRRQEPLTRRVYSSVSQSCNEDVLESLHLKPKKIIMNYLGHEEKALKKEFSEADDNLVHETPPHSSQKNEKLIPKCRRSWKREDTVLQKHLCRTRHHIRAVKQGCGYFHLLLKEQQEAQEEQRRERQRREESMRTEPRPPNLFDSDEDSDTEMWCDVAPTSSSEWKSNRRKVRAARPFTPIYRSLISTPPHLLPSECVYRQLCCLNWLLEALTLEHSGRFEPVTSCWDAKDPGRSRTTIKRLNKEKAIEAKWEQFIAPQKARHLTSKLLHVSSGSHLTCRTSTLSVVSSSVTGSSVGSLLAKALENTCEPEPVYIKNIKMLSVQESDSDSSSSENLQMSIFKTCCNPDSQLTSTPESSPVRRTSATTQLIYEKRTMLDGINAAFVNKAEELSLHLSDALDHCAKKRWNFGVQRYRSLCNMVSHGRISSAVTSVSSPRVQDPKILDSTENPYSAQWLSASLCNLAPIKYSDRKVTRLLEKLSQFTETHTLLIHTHNFLRILNSLQLWELCCPDMCVAIEIVRQNVLQMPKAEYDSWLHNRVSQSQTTKSAICNL